MPIKRDKNHSPIKLFPRWRDLWVNLEGLREPIETAESCIDRRGSGNQNMPKWDKKLTVNDRVFEALRVWANGKSPDKSQDPEEIVNIIYANISPVLKLVVWPRWLYLERAFIDASSTGDLLFAALVLRTMCEEVQRLHAIDLNVEQLSDLAGSQDPESRKRLNEFLFVAWSYISPLPRDMIVKGVGWVDPRSIYKSIPRLKQAKASLNSYVHPNYGSHIVALYPESAAAGKLLLEAVAAVYEAFFALSWAEAPLKGRTLPLGVDAPTTWRRMVQRLKAVTIPELRRNFSDDDTAEQLSGKSALEWILSDQADLELLLADPDLASLLDTLPRKNPSDDCLTPSQSFTSWEGARAANITDWALARQSEQLLTSEFPLGAPEPAQQLDWLKFNAQALHLALMLDRIKSEAFKAQIVRQIVSGNVIAIWLLVRSLIEQHALAIWLPNQIRISLDDLAAYAKAGENLPEAATKVEEPLANFLAGQTKHTHEARRAWVMGKNGKVRPTWLNLSNIISSAFGEDSPYQQRYDLASAVLHSREVRGYQLLLNAAGLRKKATLVGFSTLERLCHTENSLGPMAFGTALAVQLYHAAELGGTNVAADDRRAGQLFGDLTGGLKAGLDYLGQGTRDDPFVIDANLEFYGTQYALLQQIGINIDSATRLLSFDAHGRFCDLWKMKDREYWFLVPNIEENCTEIPTL